MIRIINSWAQGIVIAVIIYFSAFSMLMSSMIGNFFKKYFKGNKSNVNAEPAEAVVPTVEATNTEEREEK